MKPSDLLKALRGRIIGIFAGVGSFSHSIINYIWQCFAARNPSTSVRPNDEEANIADAVDTGETGEGRAEE